MSLKTNVTANYIGQGWQSIMAIAFVPLYIKYLGVEAFGLIGIFAVLQSCLALIDNALSPALCRELARFTAGALKPQSVKNLIRSVETVVLAFSLAIVALTWASSEWIASSWLRYEVLSSAEVANAFCLMGFVVGIRLFESIYRSCLIGLQEFVVLNAVTVIFSTMRGLGAVVVLVLIEPSINAFFLWQGFVSVVTIIVYFVLVQKLFLPKTEGRTQFSLVSLQEIYSFTRGTFLIGLSTVALIQVDKVILSKLLSLEAYGYYMFASLVAKMIFVLAMPIGMAYYPHFSSLLVSQQKQKLVDSFHTASQVLAVTLSSVSVVLIIFIEPILGIWTQDAGILENAKFIIVPLAIGFLLNGIMVIPHQMQLAHGVTYLAVRLNVFCLVIIVPAHLVLTPIYGAQGAAWIWAGLHLVYTLVGTYLMFGLMLGTEKGRWYLNDFFLPIGAALISVLLVSTIEISSQPIRSVIVIFIAFLAAMVTGTMVSTNLREKLISYIGDKYR